MQFEFSDDVNALVDKLQTFMQEHFCPAEHSYAEPVENADNRWATPPVIVELKAKVKAASL